MSKPFEKGAHGGAWDDEKVARLKDLWGQGFSASQIAQSISGVSRNAVIGKVHRLGLIREATVSLPERISRGLAKDNIRRVAPRQTNSQPGRKSWSFRKQRPTNAVPPKPKVRELPPERPAQNFTFARPWVTRKSGECAFPIGDGADTMSCCRPTERTYCLACEAVMYQPQPSSAKKLERMAAMFSGRAA